MQVLIKDKKDMKFKPDGFLKDYTWESHGQYDSLKFVDKDTQLLSVQFSKVGQKSYDAFPNLKWIVVRQHGFDNVNLNECETRGIGVVNTKPFAKPTADWISDKLKPHDKVMFIGYGEIAKKVSHPWPAFVVKRNTTKDEIQKQLKLHDTLVVSIPPEGNKHYINDDILKNFKGKLISVSRADVLDNDSLLRNIDNITEAHIDTLDSLNRDELLNTKKVFYYKHTAFEFNFSYEKDKYYFDHLENVIKDCIENDCKNYKPVLPRQEKVRLDFF